MCQTFNPIWQQMFAFSLLSLRFAGVQARFLPPPHSLSCVRSSLLAKVLEPRQGRGVKSRLTEFSGDPVVGGVCHVHPFSTGWGQ